APVRVEETAPDHSRVLPLRKHAEERWEPSGQQHSVVVQKEEDVSVSGLCASCDRVEKAAVRRVPEHPDSRISGRELVEPSARSVGGGVVDNDDLATERR